MFRDFMTQQTEGMRALSSCGVIGLHLVSGPAVGFGIGYGLDMWLGTTPAAGFVCLFIGIGAGFLNVYRDTKELIQKMEARSKTGSDSIKGKPSSS